jgi:hypothetical protein
MMAAWGRLPPQRNLAARAGVDILAAIATLVDATVVAALDATEHVTGGRTNHGANASTYNCSQKAAAGRACTDNSATKGANRRTLLGRGARSQRKGSGNDNQELMHEILQN